MPLQVRLLDQVDRDVDVARVAIDLGLKIGWIDFEKQSNEHLRDANSDSTASSWLTDLRHRLPAAQEIRQVVQCDIRLSPHRVGSLETNVRYQNRVRCCGLVRSVPSLIFSLYLPVATYGLTILAGSTTRSNSTSFTNPSFSAAAFNVRSLSMA